jgi:broad specificity phosphatase PhoE
MSVFEIIFIRHGESCANALHKSKSYAQWAAHTSYNDPELTSRGLLESERRGEIYLKPVLTASEGFYPIVGETENGTDVHEAKFTVGSSPLLRAQETAYLMVGRPFKKLIHIMPHIGETGFLGSWSLDNQPDPIQNQAAYLQQRMKERFPTETPKLFLRGFTVNAELEPDIGQFQDWMNQNADSYFTKGLDGVYRAVIVSHSNSLRKAFPLSTCQNPPPGLSEKQAKRWKLANNDFLVSIFDFREDKSTKVPGTFINPDAVYPKWMRFDTQGYQSAEEVPCGRNAKCGTKINEEIKKGYYAPRFRNDVPVSGCAAGGYRKTKKSKNKHKRKGTHKHRR